MPSGERSTTWDPMKLEVVLAHDRALDADGAANGATLGAALRAEGEDAGRTSDGAVFMWDGTQDGFARSSSRRVGGRAPALSLVKHSAERSQKDGRSEGDEVN